MAFRLTCSCYSLVGEYLAESIYTGLWWILAQKSLDLVASNWTQIELIFYLNSSSSRFAENKKHPLRSTKTSLWKKHFLKSKGFFSRKTHHFVSTLLDQQMETTSMVYLYGVYRLKAYNLSSLRKLKDHSSDLRVTREWFWFTHTAKEFDGPVFCCWIESKLIGPLWDSNRVIMQCIKCTAKLDLQEAAKSSILSRRVLQMISRRSALLWSAQIMAHYRLCSTDCTDWTRS